MRILPNNAALQSSDPRGFSLMEVLFALVLFSIAVSALFPAFLGHVRFNNFSEVRSASYAAAQVVLDDIRLSDPSTLPSSGSDAARDVQVGPRSFSVVVSYCEDPTYCDLETRFVTARVSYRGEQVYEVSTVYTELR
jgi:prepilin-type N-terminal cleavage/methylation domain-containing protein